MKELGGWLPMEYFIALAAVVFAVVIYGATSRRKIYRKIDTLEAWKIEIMNRPVTEEIARVKRLKMDGQTEEKFETWRHEWDDIITSELPEAEEKLFEAEEAADRYRFRKAKATLDSIHTVLEKTEVRIKAMLEDLDQLITSEESNRQDIVTIKDSYHEAKKHILTHRRHYQKAIIPIESEIKEIEDLFHTYEEQTEEGNYLEARAVLITAKEQIDSLRDRIDVLPNLFTEFQSTLPEQLQELKDGHEDMRKQGYALDHLAITEDIEAMQKKITIILPILEKAEIDRPQNECQDIKSRVEAMYDQLEKEAVSKQAVMSEQLEMEEKLDSTEKEISDLKSETKTVQLSYRIDEEDLETQQRLEKDLQQLRKKFSEAEVAIKGQKQAYSMLQDRLAGLKERLDELEEAEKQYKEMLQTLRKDEWKAKETTLTLRKRLVEAKRLIQKNNLPGLPENHLTGLQTAQEMIFEVEEKLEEKPLEMSTVNRILDEALHEVERSFALTKKLVEDAVMAERLIQYGNRYRSRYKSIDDRLRRAETSFRNFYYEEALEVATGAIEEVEPDILARLNGELNEKV
jgi:septation ring formation regulator